MKLKTYKYLILIALGFGILYSIISLINHYNFRTYALDLGLYTQGLYKYAHLEMADSSMIKEKNELLLGSHFDLYLILFSPLIYLFHTYTLLIVQIIMVLIGGLGIYKLFKQKNDKNKQISIWAMLYFYSFFGILAALSFDYHSIVVASCIIPWFFLAIKSKQMGLSIIFFISVLISQENMSLWMFFICTALFIQNKENVKIRRLLLILAGVSVIYFLCTIYIVIPYFSSTYEYGGFLYSEALGYSPITAIKTLLFNPIDSFIILFINHTNDIRGDFVKAEFHLFILLSGVYLLFLKPSYLIMLIPLYGQKLFHDYYSMWSFGGQYVVEFAPIMTIGIFNVLLQLKNDWIRKVLIFILFAGSISCSVRMMDNTIMNTDKVRIRFYQTAHYKRNYDIRSVHDQLNHLPKNAKISALSPFVPQLALRENIYQFPLIKDADFIVYSEKENHYPMTDSEFRLFILSLEKSSKWTIKYKKDGFTILQKSVDNK